MNPILWMMKKELKRLKEIGRYRFLRDISTLAGVEIKIGDKHFVNFSSNDYLGLAAHPVLTGQAGSLSKRWGIGAGASRLICGNMKIHRELEKEISEFKGTEDALVFSAGYMANLGILGTLGSQDTTVFSDELNHASIIDGCRLSKAKVMVYRHCDANHLEKLLKNDGNPKRVIITEGVFSMDGDLAPLIDLCNLRDRYGAFLVVDDAHATGTVGEGGRGTASRFGVSDRVDIQMGTFSKALGTYGAFICTNSLVRDYFINKCRPFIFNTGMPPLIAALTLRGLRYLKENPDLPLRLNKKVQLFTHILTENGFPVQAETPIIPVIVGTDADTIEVSNRLMDKGFYVYGVRPPTVPEGTGRLRVTITVAHKDEQIEECALAIVKVLKEVGIRAKQGG